MNWAELDWRTIVTLASAVVVPLGSLVVFGLARIDKKFDAMDRRVETQSNRTDKLYEMFIDLVKETRRT